ncbi:MAG: hypothetical protein A3G93_04895 [Nitrospinae bacterium RIFCSPLOWO2_12_FULL_45_22]|nr:MAG: hypothetical protein A3G93_04895 [Nitrospinae bacterium RIFCSPLOWO2_12_FULL_45_22]
MMVKRIIFFYVLISLIFVSSKAIAGDQYSSSMDKVPVRDIVLQTKGLLEEALMLYCKGEQQRAKGIVSSAYFDVFEGKGLEALLATRSSRAKIEIESIFGKIISLMRTGASQDQVEQEFQRLITRLGEAAKLLEIEEPSPWRALLNSLFIILREGFEAILIISALTAYLIKTGNDNKIKVVYQGAGFALLASIFTAFLIQSIFAQNPAGQEIMEGATMLLAAIVLFYVSYWLTSKAEAAKWMAFIQEKVKVSLSQGSLFALGFTAFLAVYREGAETVLFYQALLASGEGLDTGLIWLGFLLGSGTLAGVFFIFKLGSVRIPIRLFFTLTSIFLYYLAFSFTGQGIIEFQVGGLISATPVAFIPQIDFLRIYPTVESLTCQGILLAAALLAMAYLFILKPLKPIS